MANADLPHVALRQLRRIEAWLRRALGRDRQETDPTARTGDQVGDAVRIGSARRVQAPARKADA